MDQINHPDHYKVGSLECIDAMLQLFSADELLAFCKLNAFKYLWRANHKGNIRQDIAKANFYLSKYLELTQDNE